MKNRSYWKRRMELLEKAQLRKGESYLRNLDKQYKITSAHIERELVYWYERFAINNEISMTEARKLLTTNELKEFRWSVEEYIKHGRENALNPQWMKELENASARVHISRLQALKLQMQQQVEVLYGNQMDDLDKILRNIYSDGYYHTAYEIQRGFNIGWDLHSLNQNQLDKILSKPWSMDKKTFSDRLWSNKEQLLGTLQTRFTQAVIRGEEPKKAIDQISNLFDVDKRKAGRLVMTESAAFASIAQKDCFKALDVERFEIVATLDRRTSDLCQDLDGEVFDMKDYEVGVTAPPFHPWCRTTTVPFFEDNYGERAARGEDGEVYCVPSDIKYGEWKKQFVDGGKKENLNIANPGKTLKDKIQEIKDKTYTRGEIIEKDIKEAGGLIKEDLQSKRIEFKNQIEELKRKRKETGIEEIEYRMTRLRMARRGLINLDEVGLNGMEELRVEYDQLMQKRIKLNPIISDLETELQLLKLNYNGTFDDNINELKEKLSEIRPVGNSTFDIDGHLNNSRSPMRKIIKESYDHYPTEWIEQSVGTGKLMLKTVNRGYYSHFNKEIAISGITDDDKLKTAFHELGHRFEQVIPGILEAEKEFYERRTAGESLKWLGGRYRYDEKAKKDKFLDPYIGKDYGGFAYELISTGFEYAFTDPTRLWEDEDFAEWIYGILALF